MSTPDRELPPADALRAEREAELEAEREVEQDADVDLDDGATEPELAIALSPRQILGGFALLAAIVVWLFRRRKR